MEKPTESLGGPLHLNEPANACCKEHTRNAAAQLIAQVFAKLMGSLNQRLPLLGVEGNLRLSFSCGAEEDLTAPCALPCTAIPVLSLFFLLFISSAVLLWETVEPPFPTMLGTQCCAQSTVQVP